MRIDYEQIIDELISRMKPASDISVWAKNRTLFPIIKIINRLSAIPKLTIDEPDFARIRNQVLDRISIPTISQESKKGWFGLIPTSLRSLRMLTGLAGGGLIVVSLAVGTAVAARDSLPGQTLYPLKKVAENIHLKITLNEKQKADLQVKFAENRITELEKVLDKTEEGQISSSEASKLVAQTVQDLQKSTSAAVTSQSSVNSKASIATKLNNLNSKLKTASIKTEGEVKVELEKALAATKISEEEALANLERAGLKVEDVPVINIDEPIKNDEVTAQGKLTAVTETSVSIGTARFFLTKDTKYIGIKAAELKVNQIVSIKAEVKDKKTYAIEVTLVLDIPPEVTQ